jgi:serine/threonine-protein kinase
VSVKPDRISSYQITDELGKGSMGVVYEGQPDDGSPPVAVKVFYPETQLTPEETSTLKERFDREGSALAQLQHRNVVRVIEAGTAEDLDYIVMEKLQGYNLKELQALGTRFTLADTFDIILQLLGGLAACHRMGIVHRDVKPANIVRAPDGVIKLTDFGIARIITDQTLSRSGTIVGTPNYMSPEQIRGEDVDPRSDIFSAGVVMYELLTGKKPFDGPDMTSIMYNVTNVHPPPPRFYNGALPTEIEEITYRAIAKNPGERFATSDEFASALRELEQSLHYHDDSETVLNALPSSPDPDVSLSAPASSGTPASSQANSLAASIQSQISQASGQISLSGAGGIKPGTVYCIDCGMPNDADSQFCVRCMRPLLKRDLVGQLASQQAKLIHRIGRADYIFLGCLSFLMAALAIFIIYLFFSGGRP